MTKVLVLGAGKIGVSIAGSLADAGDYNVTLADGDAQTLESRGRDDVEKIVLDAAGGEALSQGLDGFDVVVSALPYFLNVTVAEAAKARGVHYFDLTEDVRVARKVMALAEGAGGRLRSPVRAGARLHLHRRQPLGEGVRYAP